MPEEKQDKLIEAINKIAIELEGQNKILLAILGSLIPKQGEVKKEEKPFALKNHKSSPGFEEEGNYIEVEHVTKDGKAIQTAKAYLFKNSDGLVAWVAKSSIKDIHTMEDNMVRVIFQEDKAWAIEKLAWKKEEAKK